MNTSNRFNVETLARQRQTEIEKYLRQMDQIRSASSLHHFAPSSSPGKIGVALFSILILLVLIISACAPQSALASEQPKGKSVEQVWSIRGDPKPFNYSDGIAVEKQGNLYVMDSYNHRL